MCMHMKTAPRVGPEMCCSRVIPFLSPLCAEMSLKNEEFSLLCNTIKKMFKARSDDCYRVVHDRVVIVVIMLISVCIDW